MQSAAVSLVQCVALNTRSHSRIHTASQEHIKHPITPCTSCTQTLCSSADRCLNLVSDVFYTLTNQKQKENVVKFFTVNSQIAL